LPRSRTTAPVRLVDFRPDLLPRPTVRSGTAPRSRQPTWLPFALCHSDDLGRSG